MDSIKIKFHVVQGGFEMIFQGIETIEDEVVEGCVRKSCCYFYCVTNNAMIQA